MQLMRPVGAIGLFTKGRLTVEAPTLAEAEALAYETHNPYLSWRLEPAGENANGLTWRRWAYAAGILLVNATDENRNDWAAGVDPSEYRAAGTFPAGGEYTESEPWEPNSL